MSHTYVEWANHPKHGAPTLGDFTSKIWNHSVILRFDYHYYKPIGVIKTKVNAFMTGFSDVHYSIIIRGYYCIELSIIISRDVLKIHLCKIDESFLWISFKDIWEVDFDSWISNSWSWLLNILRIIVTIWLTYYNTVHGKKAAALPRYPRTH